MDKNEFWQTILAELQLNLSKASFSSWFTNIKVINLKKIDAQKRIFTLGVSNFYVKDTLEDRYSGQIKEICDRVSGHKFEIKIVVKDQAAPTKKEDTGPLFNFDYAQEKRQALEKAIKAGRLNPNFTFENFAVSSTNEMAHAAAQAVAKNPGQKYHLLFLYGGVGVGKTHLGQAIAHRVLENDPSAAVVCCTSEEFTNGIVEAIRSKSTREFRQKYRLAKVLLIDDIQFIGGKESVQEEFFHTFNAIHAEGGQIVLTSDCLPHEIHGLEDRLRSRFEGGLTVDVQEPNFELRTAILLIKAKQRGAALPMDVAQLIAGNITSTRKLEGFLTQLISRAETKKELITPFLCKELLEKTSVPAQKIASFVKPKEVLEIVAEYFSLKPNQLKSAQRAKPIVVPRQIAMYLIRNELKTSFMEVGYLFGGRDHTTVMHAVKKIEKMVDINENLRVDVESLKKRIYA